VPDSAVRIALLAPDLLGTYGDAGNAIVLERRLAWRGIGAEVVPVATGTSVPESCDLYLLGGGEDAQQTLALTELAAGGGLTRAAERGAVVLAVCAGYQILGRRFPGVGGADTAGLDLLDVESVRTGAHRAVGELLAEPIASSLGGVELGTLTGFENHGARTRLGPEARPLAAVSVGIGNGFERLEGAVQGRIVATYLHGPALARNPALADLLLRWVVGPLRELDVAEVERLRGERISSARARTRRGRRWPRGA